MIDFLLEMVAACLLVSGSIIILLGSIGMLKLPDFFCRLHSAGVIETLGAWLLAASIVVAFKVLLIGVLIFVLSPVSSHILARTALEIDQVVPGEDSAMTGYKEKGS